MTFRTTVPIALIVLAASGLNAQDVRVEVVKHADGRPIPGTLLTLASERDSAQPAKFSDASGRATFRAPRRGGYRIRAERVGYDTWNSVMLVPSANPTRVRAGMKLRSLRLPPVTGKTETRCANISEQATATGDMWGEIRKALAANRVTQAQGLVSLDIETYDRAFDSAGKVISERTDRRRANASYNDFGSQQLRLPDASSLLSPDFIATHCFSSIRGSGAENGLLGLEFKPAKLGNKPDLSGVLWLDPTTYSLRHLVFKYVNVPASSGAGRASGRVDFQPLAGGEWIVSRWRIRIPRSGAGSAGYNESAGMARAVGVGHAEPEFALVTAADTGETRITGSVFDGTTGRPLPGVSITTTSGRYSAITNSGGGYELVVDGAFADTLIFDHPRLRLFRVARVQPVSVRSGGRTQLAITIPAIAVLRPGLCPEHGRQSTAGVAVGYVKDAEGKPIPNARVSGTWLQLWTEEQGRLVASRQQRTVDTRTAADGSYILCGFTRDTQVTLGVAVDGTPRVEEIIPFPRSMVLERDFTVRAR